MIFHVLGPLEARQPGGAVVGLGGRKSGTVLAILLLHPNAWVGVDHLMAATWHEQAAPASAEANLKTYVCRLRRVLPGGSARIESRPGAYRLRVAPGELDTERAEELASAARDALAAGDHAAAAPLIEDALALWRGTPFDGLTVDEACDEAARLNELRRDLRENLAEARLALGRHHDAITVLRALTAEDPLRESAWTLLVRALDEAGRRGEALTAYRGARSALAEELGVEPGPALAAAHRKALTAGAPAVHPRRELPRDVAGFVGRDAQFAALRRGPGHSPVVVVDGMTGVGKTAFAVHAAHRLAPEFPDGQFFVDLRAGGLCPGEALARLLRGIGIDAVPVDVDERAALWRSELARRRVLLVLDDAADDAQVRPLLPGASASLTLITTRHRGWRLQGERRVELRPLGEQESAVLFHRASGRTTAPAAVVRACGGLPGALLTAAARLKARPLWTADDLAGWIAEEPDRLLDPAGVTASWRGLTPAGRVAFHALGALPAEFDCRLAAQHTGTRSAETRRALEELVDAHLLDTPAIGRYRSHPLVRAHAGRLSPSSARVA